MIGRTFCNGFQTSADEERATRFPFPNPSPRAGNGREKSGAGAPKEVRRIYLQNSVNNSKIIVKGNEIAAGGAGMRLFRMIISIFVMLIAGLIGFFVGIRIDEAMGGAVLFSVIAGIACVIYTIENQEK